MRKTAQNYEIKVQSSGGSSHRPSGGSGGGGTKPTQPTKPEQPTKPVEPQQPEQSTEPVMNFTDVSPEGWFYNEVLWVFTEKLMQGNGDGTFGPNNPTSPAALVTVLARLSGADLTTYANESYADVIENKWYSDYAKWAKGNGLLGEIAFEADSTISRSNIAQILLKYLQALGVELPQVEQPQQFADAERMTAEENANFQILYALGIFQGNGDNSMNSQGATTRAELAALLHRVSNALILAEQI
ncbi:MAG: S-layer homology domain-containing protein [Firmicutes bacterium]|nr:S-layer homology domain-containing protein [Bacillota bacterium]